MFIGSNLKIQNHSLKKLFVDSEHQNNKVLNFMFLVDRTHGEYRPPVRYICNAHSIVKRTEVKAHRRNFREKGPILVRTFPGQICISLHL